MAGAEVQVRNNFGHSAENAAEAPHLVFIAQEKTVADAAGRWRINRFAKEVISGIAGFAKHPDYFTEPFIEYPDGNIEAEKQLLAGTCIFKLTRGIPVRGVVLDTDGHPVPGAKLAAVAEIENLVTGQFKVAGQTVMIQRVDLVETTNQADGTFTLTGCRPGTNEFIAEARGFALANMQVVLANNPASLRFVLQPGHVLRLRVLDANGLPVTNNCEVYPNPLEPSRGISIASRSGRGAGLGPLGPRGNRSFRADAEGRVVWESSPDSELRLGFRAVGLVSTNMVVPADGVEHVVTLTSAPPTAPHLTITGSVRDAATRQPIARFRITTGGGRGQTFQGGKFQFSIIASSAATRFKFEAEGYAPFVTGDMVPAEGTVQLDVALSPAPSTSVTVLSRDGQPSANVDIGFEMSGNPLRPTPGGLRHLYPGNYTNVFLTDERGRFVLPPDDSIKRVIAAGQDGYADATPAELAASPAMHLQPWGRIEGTYLSNGKPAAGRKMSIYSVTTSETTFLCSDFLVETDASGHFVFQRVTPGQICLNHQEMLDLGGNRRAVNMTRIPATVRLGETTTVSLQFYTVTARLRWPAGVNRDANWWVGVRASQPASIGQSAASFAFKQGDDGTWTIEDVTPGNYTVSATVSILGPVGTPDKPLFRAETTLVIPQGVSDGAKDVGELMLQPVP